MVDLTLPEGVECPELVVAISAFTDGSGVDPVEDVYMDAIAALCALVREFHKDRKDAMSDTIAYEKDLRESEAKLAKFPYSQRRYLQENADLQWRLAAAVSHIAATHENRNFDLGVPLECNCDWCVLYRAQKEQT